jgi:hypothetical protein
MARAACPVCAGWVTGRHAGEVDGCDCSWEKYVGKKFPPVGEQMEEYERIMQIALVKHNKQFSI